MMAVLLFTPFVIVGVIAGYRLLTGRADDEILDRENHRVR